MKIEIISVSALDDGAEILLTIKISNGEGRGEKRKLLLFTEQYLELGLCKGAIIDMATFDKLEEMSKRCKAIRKGSELLSYSSSSRVRLAQRLRAKGVDKESAEDAAEHLQKLGAINESNDVERLIRGDLKKLWGRKRIYSDLCSKGYDRDIITEKLDEIENDVFVENCRALFLKKYKIMPSDSAEQKKVFAALVRYGYTFSQIREALQNLQ